MSLRDNGFQHLAMEPAHLVARDGLSIEGCPFDLKAYAIAHLQ
jgi:hypothetical protein